MALDAATTNFQSAARDVGERQWQGVLLLAEVAGVDAFRDLSQRVGYGHWSFKPVAGEPISLRVESAVGQLLLIAGRQVATSEGLEVLALATREQIVDDRDLMSTLREARRISNLVVLPWAVGKWLGRRGRLVKNAFRNAKGSIFAGDNGGRPWFWPAASAFDLARHFGRPVLPGSDPLPIPGEESRIGSRGFAVKWALPEQQPAAELCAYLCQPRLKPYTATAQARLRCDSFTTSSFCAPRCVHHHAKGTRFLRETPDVETSSANYASRFSGAAGRYLLEAQTAAITRSVANLPPGTLLDVGGGHGQVAAPLRNLGWDVTVHGSDPICARNLRELHDQVGVTFVSGDLLALPFRDRSFEVVTAVRLVSHVEQWPRLLDEMCRVARRTVIIDYPSKFALNALTPLMFGLKKAIEGNTRTYLSFTRHELAGVFEHNGFAISREEKQFFLPMVLHRMSRAAAPVRAVEHLCRALGLTALAGSPVILRADRCASPGD